MKDGGLKSVVPVWVGSGSNQITLCDTRHSHHILLNLSAINMINKHRLECETNIFFFHGLGFLRVPCSRFPHCEQSEAVPSQDCGWVPRGKSRQTAVYSWKEGRRGQVGWTAAGADCGTGIMSGRLHPPLRLYGTAVQAMGNVYDLEQFWRKGCLGHGVAGSCQEA